MKWFIYLVATGLISLAAYPAYVRIDTGFEGIVGWITATIAGGWFFGFVGNLVYDKRRAKDGALPDGAHSDAAIADNGKQPKASRTVQFFISI